MDVLVRITHHDPPLKTGSCNDRSYSINISMFDPQTMFIWAREHESRPHYTRGWTSVTDDKWQQIRVQGDVVIL